MLLPLALVVAGAVQQVSLERELAVRALALHAPERAAELARLARDEDWRARLDALDALRRAQDLGLALELPRGRTELLEDPHPNVRALGAALVLRAEPGLAAGELARLAADPFPLVRLELARALADRPGAHAAATLLALSEDPDARVAAEAARLLFARGPEDLAAKLAWVEREDALASAARFGALLERNLRAPPDPGWIEAVRARLRAGEASPAMRASWEALAYVQLGAGDAALLARGWLAPLGEPSSPAALAWEELRSRAARAGDGALLEALLDELRAPPERGVAELVVAAVDCADGRYPRLFEALAELPPRVVGRALTLLTGRVERVPEAALARWLEPEAPLELRAAAAGCAADALVRGGDEASGRALAGVLADEAEELRWIAFEALSDAADPRPWLAATHAFWRALPDDAARAEALRELSRAAAPTPYRADLVALWEEGRARTPSVLELLALFRGDAEVGAALARWLERELAWLDAHAPPAADAIEPDEAWRQAEGRAQALVRALERIEGARAAPAIEAALARVDGRSEEVAKVAAAALARSAEGRARLARWMRPEGSSRVRIEAALQLAGERTEEAVTLLVERYPSCDEELRLRVLRAFAPLADERCVPQLARAASGAGHSAAERVVALEALGASARPEDAVRALAEVLATAGDPDLERGAVASLGQLGHAAAAPILVALLEDPARAELARDEALPALARLAPERAGALLLAGPRAHARAELARRFRGERTPATEFRYRGELAAARSLAERGLLNAALNATPGWWEVDGRLLLELGRAAAEGGERPAARRLFAAARVALRGEGPAHDLEAALCGARVAALSLALLEGDWAAAEAAAAALLLDWRGGRTSERGFRLQLGLDDPRAGRDAQGWLAASRLQAAALAAHARGARSEAARLALAAARAVGRSERARAQQERLEAALR